MKDRVIELRYYNTNGISVVIVAVETEGIDYAVYIGALSSKFSESQAIENAARSGAKLPEQDARHYLDLNLPYRI